MLPNDAAYTTLATDILTTHQAEFAVAVAENDDPTIATAYNVLAVPDFWVWRTSVQEREIYEMTSVDATTWSWTIYIGRTANELAAWERMFGATGRINPSLANTRAGVADIFSGAGGAAQRTHLLAIGRRKATRAEKLLATGTGSTGSPAVMTFEGVITIRDVGHALRGAPLT